MKHFAPAIFLAAIVWGFLTPEVPDGHGFDHDRFTAMDQGGDGADRHGPVMISGWLLGASSIAIFVGLLAWAAERAMSTGSPNVRRLMFVAGGLLFEGLFALTILAAVFSLYAGELVALLGALGWSAFAIAIVPTVAIGFNWKRATPLACNLAMIIGVGMNFGLKFAEVGLPYGFHGGALSLLVSLTVFYVVSIASSSKPIPQDIETLMDL